MNSRIWRLVAAMGAIVISLAGSLPAPADTLAPAFGGTREVPYYNWAFVRVLDPYGNPLSEAGVWVNPRSGSPVIQLKELANGWNFARRVLRGVTDVTALHLDYTLASIPPLMFSPSKPLAAQIVNMLENDASLEGFVTDSITKQPIYPAYLNVLRAPPDDLGLLYGATYGNPTDESGHFYYEMATDFYDGLYVSAGGYQGFLVQPYNAPAGHTALNFELTPLPDASTKAESGERIRIQIDRK